ncbi:Gibberellin 20 oxidase 1-A [Platanthera zijinensis]|uniref:Gibberellin 20 oxidase 1-A n=1 Tax=Platanthera zijinensis TaxID=2320716 RepID=A0AAP0BES2_9ASPA
MHLPTVPLRFKIPDACTRRPKPPSESLSRNRPLKPSPDLILGARPHCDPESLTIIHLDDVIVRQIFSDDRWRTIFPKCDACVLNIGDTFGMHPKPSISSPNAMPASSTSGILSERKQKVNQPTNGLLQDPLARYWVVGSFSLNQINKVDVVHFQEEMYAKLMNHDLNIPKISPNSSPSINAMLSRPSHYKRAFTSSLLQEAFQHTPIDAGTKPDKSLRLNQREDINHVGEMNQ